MYFGDGTNRVSRLDVRTESEGRIRNNSRIPPGTTDWMTHVELGKIGGVV